MCPKALRIIEENNASADHKQGRNKEEEKKRTRLVNKSYHMDPAFAAKRKNFPQKKTIIKQKVVS